VVLVLDVHCVQKENEQSFKDGRTLQHDCTPLDTDLDVLVCGGDMLRYTESAVTSVLQASN